MKTVFNISLVDVLRTYKDYTASDFLDKGDYYLTTCPFPDHPDTEPSFAIYKNERDGGRQRYKCFSGDTCGSGDVLELMCKLGLAKNTTVAREVLERDFEIHPPNEWTLESFAEYKDLSKDLLIDMGIRATNKGLHFPYYDENGKLLAEKIRPHPKNSGDKYYYASGSPVPYGLWRLKPDDPDVFITEGETDCLTFLQAGYRAVCIPSATAWSDTFTKYFSGIPKIIAVIDNDDAGLHLLESLLKSFPSNLYRLRLPKKYKDANDFHSIRCNGDIDTFKEQIDRLPCLPATPQCFLTAVDEDDSLLYNKEAFEALAPMLGVPTVKEKFIYDLSKKFEHLGKKAIGDMFATHDERDIGGIFERDNCYFKLTAQMYEKQLTNFVIRPKYIKLTDEGASHLVSLVNIYDEVTDVELEPDDLALAPKFAEKLIRSGRYLFYGERSDLISICEKIFQEVKRTVHAPLAIGHLTEDHWVFGNCGIDKTGVVRPIEDGVITLDGTHYRPQSLVRNSEDADFGGFVPKFNLELAPLSTEELGILANKFKENIGTYDAWMGLGFCVAAWYSDVVFAEHECFPFLFIVGKKGQGKTTFARLLNSAFGYSSAYSGASFDASTVASMSRAMNYPRSLPLWYDDYKDQDANDAKTQMLLGAYNRQGGNRAVLGHRGIEARIVKAVLMISGEYAPSRAALKDRCVTLVLSGARRCDEIYPEVHHAFKRLQINGLQWASEVRTRKEEFLRKQKSYEEFMLSNPAIDARTALNYSIMMAGFDIGFGQACEMEDFIGWCVTHARHGEEVVNETHHLSMFFNDLIEMQRSEKSEFMYGHHIELDVKNNILYIHRNDVYRLWRAFRNGRVPINEETLRNDLDHEPYATDKVNNRHYYLDRTRSVSFTFDFAKMKAIEKYSDFCERIEALSRNPDAARANLDEEEEF